VVPSTAGSRASNTVAMAARTATRTAVVINMKFENGKQSRRRCCKPGNFLKLEYVSNLVFDFLSDYELERRLLSPHSPL
jgi:hypothetical protein